MKMAWGKWLFVIAVICIIGAVVYQNGSTKPSARPKPPRKSSEPPVGSTAVQPAAALPHLSSRDGFVSSSQCRRCHEEQFNSWHDSYHRTMTQVAKPETVVAPFDDIRLSSRGRDYFLSHEGDKFFVTMADPDWEAGAEGNGLDLTKVDPPVVKREIVMTTGSHHMQGYWVPSNKPNMLRQLPFTYLIGDKRWVPREDLFIAPEDGGRHFAVWNDNCIVCHATAGNPNFDLRSLKVATEVVELGISCEACHGPGQSHIDYHDKKLASATAKDPILNPAKCEPRIASEICGQCHSYFEPHNMQSFATHGYTYRAGGDLAASHKLVSYEEAKATGNESALGSYWRDGTGRLAGREYSAMKESPCFKNGPMTCISCHSSHSSQPDDQLAKDMLTNKACLQCHPKFEADLSAHTHHAADSSGSLCYNCHMPHTSFGLLKAMRSHRVQSPRVVTAAESDQPNACNLCHLDQSLDWSAEKLNQWYGQPNKLVDISADADEKRLAAGLLWMTKGNAVQRAVASWHAAWPPAKAASGKDWQTPVLAQLLVDDYAAVRYVAAKSLGDQAQREGTVYDYVGPADQRQAISNYVLANWAGQAQAVESNEAAQQRAARLLINPSSGQLNILELRRLIQVQDKSPIFLPE